MATKFALFHALFLSLSFILFFSLPTTTTTTTKPHRLSIKLIHRYSFLSPFYNSTETLSDRGERAFQSSLARLAIFDSTNDIRARVVPDNRGKLFLANFSIGTPPVPVLLSLDTGSDLLWLQCYPCTTCYKQYGPIFDPSKSSTYTILSCHSPSCISFNSDNTCDSSDHCKYKYDYADHDFTKGNLVTDFLTLDTSDEGITTVPNVVFGCGHENKISGDHQEGGILGLGYSNISLIPQLHSDLKFSHCFGNLSDPSYTYSQLILGAGAKLEGYTTPIELYGDRYYLSLEDISVGTESLHIPPGTFTRRLSSGGVLIDSGTPLTYLVDDGFNILSDKIVQYLDPVLRRTTIPNYPKFLCYQGNVNRDLTGFPVITFHFAGGTDLVLEIGSSFLQYNENILCLAIGPSFFNGVSIIGILAQQFYNIGYDIADKKAYFQLIDCQLLDD